MSVPNAGLTLTFGQGSLGANTKVDFKPLVSAPVATSTPSTGATGTATGTGTAGGTGTATGTGTPAIQQQLQTARETTSTALTVLSDRGVPPPPGVTGTTGNLIQSVFQLDATNTTNGQTTNTFNAPVTLAIVVPPGTLSLAGGNLANVQVFRFNESTGAWVQVACTSGSGGLSCSTSGFSIWAMVVVPVATATIATPGGTGATPVVPRPAATGTGVTQDATSILPMLALVLLAGTLTGAGAYAVQRRRV